VQAFVDELGLWRLAAEGEPLCRLATEAGRIRPARGHDRSLLDLSRLDQGARVLMPRVSRPEWDAASLAAALGSDGYASERGLVFEPVDGRILKLIGEDRIHPSDLALRHDDADRRGWLAQQLRALLAVSGRVDALLLGPWLGVKAAVAAELERELGLPVGEILAGPGGPAGMRFEVARDALLGRMGVAVERRRVAAVEVGDGELATVLADGEERAVSESVVLALGGLVSGGVRYDPPSQHAGTDIAAEGAAPFRLSLAVPLPLQALGHRIDVVGSMHGPAIDQLAWPIDADPGLLEAVGIAGEGLAALPGVYAAGDVLADRPRTLLQAVYSGLVAGAAAAGEPGVIQRSQAL
jgi:glycerol-3-phosphate dehydrogenase subunit B